MKTLFIAALVIFSSVKCFAQQDLVSYDDIKYLLHNNLQRADTFFVAKGYTILKKDNPTRIRKYTIRLRAGTTNTISARLDGKKMFLEIETNEIDQYNLLRESIAQYLLKDNTGTDIQAYAIKDLGNIYITINETVPYNPIRKDYDIQVVADKHIMAVD